MESFEEQKAANISALGADEQLKELSRLWVQKSGAHRYAFNFSWLGRPIIQLPQDIIAMQEIIWQVQPDLIIETGIAHGGSLIFYASMLELLGGEGQVVGVDIDIRDHNRVEIEMHAMHKRIKMIEGSSVEDDVVQQVYDLARGRKPILVVLDSNHTHAHVLRELELYSPLVTRGSYLVVFDTVIEDMPENFFPDRPWGKGDNPKTAVYEYLERTDCFEIDRLVSHKLMITASPDGFLRRIK